MKFYILIFATIAVINQIQVEAFFLDAIFYKTKPLCEFICSNGSKPAIQQPNNSIDLIADLGCRAINLTFEFNGDMSDFPDCCNELVECVNQCGVPFHVCNQFFTTCLQDSCSQIDSNNDLSSTFSNRACQETGKILEQVTLDSRCQLYSNAQKSACEC